MKIACGSFIGGQRNINCAIQWTKSYHFQYSKNWFYFNRDLLCKTRSSTAHKSPKIMQINWLTQPFAVYWLSPFFLPVNWLNDYFWLFTDLSYTPLRSSKTSDPYKNAYLNFYLDLATCTCKHSNQLHVSKNSFFK